MGAGIRSGASLAAIGAFSACFGGDLRAPESLPRAGTAIAIYRARDDRVPTVAAYGVITTAQAATSGYRPPDPPPSPPPPSPSVALVVDRRWVALERGVHEIRLGGVAATLDPSSTWVQSLSDPEATALLAQRYQASPSTPDALLSRAIGRTIEISTEHGPLTGRLLGVDAAELTIVDADGMVRTVPRGDAVRSIGLGSDDAAGEPVLSPTLRVDSEGRHLIEVAYEASGLSWWVDYTVEVSRADGGAADVAISARATIDNGAGMRIDGARISLFAGTLGTGGEDAALVWSGRATIGRGQQKQFPIRRDLRGVDGAIEYVYRGALPDPSPDDKEPAWGTQSHGMVRRQVVFRNAGKVATGGVLPMGRAMVTLAKGRGIPPERFESHLRERVDVGEKARFDVGQAMQVQGERRQIQVERSGDGKQVTERYMLKVRNLGSERVNVTVIEPLARSGSATVRKTEPAAERHGDELYFALAIEPGGEKTATVDVSYRW